MSDNFKGFFLSIEGTDGSGKSTIAKKLYAYLSQKGIDAILTREPGCDNIPICQNIRNILLDNEDLSSETEALLFAANRAEHVNKLIIPALSKNQFIISDRYIDSSLSYQGVGKNLGIKKIYEINMFATNKTMPDMTILILLKPEIAMKRLKNRHNEINHLDNLGLSFFNDVYYTYIKIAKKFKKRIVVIDGNQDIESIFNEVIKAINHKLKKGEYLWNEI